MTVQQTIVAYKNAHQAATPEEIAKYVKKMIPGAKTTPGSVACTLNRAGIRAGAMFGDKKKKEALPTFDVTKTAKPKDDEPQESDEEARERILLRYEAMERLAPRVIDGKLRSLIISGPPGVSKGYTVTEAFQRSGRRRHDGVSNVGGGGPMFVTADGKMLEYGEERLPEHELHPGYYDHISGSCSAVGLYHALWNMRNGGVLFLDDCDSVFDDPDARNCLKIATDTTKERLVSWRKNSAWLEDYGIEKTFDFKGQIIFISNIDFEEVVRRDGRDAEHFKALIDRAAYLCLTIRSARDFMIVIDWKAAGENGFLHKTLDQKQINVLMAFVKEHQNKFYNLSLRLVGQIAEQMLADPEHWQRDVLATKCRTI